MRQITARLGIFEESVRLERPDLRRSVSARQAPFFLHPFNKAVLAATKPFQ